MKQQKTDELKDKLIKALGKEETSKFFEGIVDDFQKTYDQGFRDGKEDNYTRNKVEWLVEAVQQMSHTLHILLELGHGTSIVKLNDEIKKAKDNMKKLHEKE